MAYKMHITLSRICISCTNLHFFLYFYKLVFGAAQAKLFGGVTTHYHSLDKYFKIVHYRAGLGINSKM